MSAAVPQWAVQPPMGPDTGSMTRLPSHRRKPRTLQIQTQEAGRIALLRITGPIDVVTTPALTEAVERWRRPGQRLILDLRDVDYIESPGLRLLMALEDQLHPTGGQVRLVVLPGSRVERTLGLVGLNQRFPVFASSPEAWVGRPVTAEEIAGGMA